MCGIYFSTSYKKNENLIEFIEKRGYIHNYLKNKDYLACNSILPIRQKSTFNHLYKNSLFYNGEIYDGREENDTDQIYINLQKILRNLKNNTVFCSIKDENKHILCDKFDKLIFKDNIDEGISDDNEKSCILCSKARIITQDNNSIKENSDINKNLCVHTDFTNLLRVKDNNAISPNEDIYKNSCVFYHKNKIIRSKNNTTGSSDCFCEKESVFCDKNNGAMFQHNLEISIESVDLEKKGALNSENLHVISAESSNISKTDVMCYANYHKNIFDLLDQFYIYNNDKNNWSLCNKEEYKKNCTLFIYAFSHLNKFMNSYDCDFSFLYIQNNFVYFFKDDIGKKSFGYTLKEDEITISSVSFDIELEPQFIYFYCLKSKTLFKAIKHENFLKNIEKYQLLKSISIDLKNGALRLNSLLREGMLLKLHNQKKVIFFSGGIDSLILAIILNSVASQEDDIYLINTEFKTYEESKDYKNAILAFQELQNTYKNRKFVFIHNHISKEKLKEYEERIWKLIYPKNKQMDFNIGAVLFFSAKKAKEFSDVVYTGSGADEIFCGYKNHRVANVQLKKRICDDIAINYERNSGRDDRVISDNMVEGRYPFLSKFIIEEVLKYPSCFLIHNNEGNINNKIILRELLKHYGFERASNMDKTAMQFGSNIKKNELKEINAV